MSVESSRSLIVEATRAEYTARTVSGAEGCWITMADGRRLLDFHSQYMCVGVGHGHPRIKRALHEAIDGVDFVCELMDHQSRAVTSRLLVEDTMEHSDWWGSCRFVSSGSEAVEMALLIARTYTNRPTIVVSQASYHGWTTGATAATSMPHMRNVFHDMQTGEVRYVPTSHPEFHAAPVPVGLMTDEQIRACAQETERVIRAVGIQNVAGFMMEIYKGAAGFLLPDLYVRLIREMTQRLGILWIDDEVIAGAGRTGKWWAFQHTGVEPDIVATAKGISSSAVPAGAVIVNKDIDQFFSNGRWASASTNSGHPLAMAAIAANIELINDEQILQNVTTLGRELAQRLGEFAEKYSCIGSVSGRGFAWGIDIVKPSAPHEKWQPADRWFNPGVDAEPEFAPAQYIADKCEERSVLLFVFVPNTVTLAPPLTLNKEELDLAMNALDYAFGCLEAHVAAAH